MPDAQLNKRVAAVKAADAINAIEGVPPTDCAKTLTAKWALGELSFDAAKAALLEHHRHPADPKWNREGRDPYLYEDVPVLRNLLGVRGRMPWTWRRRSCLGCTWPVSMKPVLQNSPPQGSARFTRPSSEMSTNGPAGRGSST